MKPTKNLVTAYALKVVLDRVGGGTERTPARRRESAKARRAPGGSESSARPVAALEPVRRGPLFALMVAAAGIGVPLMIIFEHPITRIIGVLACFAFIVSGVFLIADPAFLEYEEEPA
jgi:hypothetical protein